MASDLNNKNPWNTLKKEEIYDNPWITVFHDEVINPGGEKGIYGRVQFKNIAVGILAIDKQGYIYLVGQFRYAINQYSWEIPEGGCPKGEDPLEAAKRELKEETGITAETWTELQLLHTSNSVTDECAIIYLAENLSFGNSEPETCEELSLKKIHEKEALEWVMEGKITDAISVASIYAYQQIKKKRGL